MHKKIILPLFFIPFVVSCKKVPTMTLEQIEQAVSSSSTKIIEKTVSKPYDGSEYKNGLVGGVWNSTISADPKTFNQLIAERDGSSSSIVSMMTDYLAEYNAITGEWESRAASFEIEVDQKNKTLTVHFTIADDMYWSFYQSDEKRPVTSEDIVWWYNNISGNPEFQSSGYGGQFVKMPDGSQKRVEAKIIDDKHFDFVYPRIVSDPILFSNDTFKPCWVYKEAFEKNGVEGVKNLFSIDTDVKTIPSCGRFFLTEYSPSQRLVFTRNPDYHEKDSKQTSLPYIQQEIVQIIDNENTSFLLFRQGTLESYSPQPEQLADIINAQGNDYTVFNSEGSLGAQFWTFNQNPKNKNEPYYEWFSKKEFRQAMSCLLNRDRIINQTYRGLAEPKYNVFPKGNPYYNPDIELKYKYDAEKAKALLASIEIKQDAGGVMRDSKGREIEFDLAIASSANVTNDIAQIIYDECKNVGIKVNVRQTDFQKMVEMVTATYDWQSLIIGLGSNLFPSQGTNVWPSSSNLHLWNPFQKTPATAWEARLDYVYNEGCYTVDHELSQKLWDEFQNILLEECPFVYLVCSRNFYTINNRWSFDNFYFDSINGAMTEHVYLNLE